MNTDTRHSLLSPQSSALSTHSVIVGGGLAGIAAAVALRSAGYSMTIIESRANLGGRASSYLDPESGELLDNSQHILMGCCTNLLDLYERLNVADQVVYFKSTPFRDEHGRRFALHATPGLPAPLHMAVGFAFFGLLTLKEKIAAARAMRAMLRMGKSGREKLANVSFEQWLAELRQPASLLPKLYDPVLVGALNERTCDVSAKYAIQVFQDALLAHRRGFRIGVARQPLSQLYDKLPNGIEIRLNTRVEEIVFEGNGAYVRAVGVKLRDGTIIRSDKIILATNHHVVQKWVGPEFYDIDPRFARLSEIDAVPILGSYMVFDRPVLKEPIVGFIKGPLQWLFRKNNDGSAVAGVISVAGEWAGKSRQETLAAFVNQIKKTLPGTRDAQLLRGTVVIEKRATFSPVPGIDDLRPAQAPPASGVQGLFLAGDYTQTHWPATMEGAVRSGYLAAQAVSGQKFLADDLKIEWPARMMGLCK